MIAARLGQGAAGALVFAPALALAGDLAQKGASGSELSVLTMGFGLGICGQVGAGFLVRWGYPVPFATAALLTAATTFLVWRETREVSGRAAGKPTPMPAWP